jgi:anaerobic selenocysteine-containing dehydrogenase
MKLTRRNFLAWAGLSAIGAVACEGFGIRHGEFDLQSPVSLPEDLVKGKDNWYATICRTCPVGEGVVVRVMEGRAKKIQGNPLYPVNQGKQSARCEAGLQAVYHPDRVTGPMWRSGVRGSGHYSPVPWSDGPGITALDILGQRLEERGDSMVMVTEPLRGHLGMLVDRFANAMGGRHLGFEVLDNNTYRAAIKNVFGQDQMPDFDLANTRFLLSFGADFLSTWLSPTRWSLGYGELRRSEGKERGVHYQVDPRFSMTAANADRWVPIDPGWEGHLALSLAYVILSEGLEAPGVDVGALTEGQGPQALEAFRPEAVAQRIGFTRELVGADPADFIRELARRFAGNRPGLAIGGGSAGAHSNGLFSLEAIYALNYLVGSVGNSGGIKFNPPSPLEGVPATANTGTLADWGQITDQLRSGQIRMMMLHHADPVHGLPGSLRLREAITESDDLFVVSFSPFLDDTTILADLILPDRVYLEDWGDDVPEPGPGYQVLGFQQPVVNPLHDLDPRSFPDVLLAVAQELDKSGDLPWNSYQQMLKEGAESLFELNRGSVDAGSSDDFWNKLLQRGGWWDQDTPGPTTVTPPNGLLNRIAGKATEPQFPGLSPSADTFYLLPFSHNTLLDGQNAHLPWLQAAPDPLTTITWQTWVEMHDLDAAALGVREGDVVRVESSRGSIRALVYPTPAVPRGTVSVPLGQGRRSGSDYATGRPGLESANVLDIIEPNQIDGTGALAWANTRVRVSPTGDSVKVSKFEGIVRAVEVGTHPGERIIHTVTPHGT